MTSVPMSGFLKWHQFHEPSWGHCAGLLLYKCLYMDTVVFVFITRQNQITRLQIYWSKDPTSSLKLHSYRIPSLASDLINAINHFNELFNQIEILWIAVFWSLNPGGVLISQQEGLISRPSIFSVGLHSPPPPPHNPKTCRSTWLEDFNWPKGVNVNDSLRKWVIAL